MKYAEDFRHSSEHSCPGELYEVVEESVFESFIGQEKMLAMDATDFVAGQWAATAEQKHFYHN